MFKNTIAVGPLEPTEFCVTGGVCTEARHLAAWVACLGRSSDDADDFGREMLLESFVADCRRAMAATRYSVIVSGARLRCCRVHRRRDPAFRSRTEVEWNMCPCAGETEYICKPTIAERADVFADPGAAWLDRIGQQLMTGCHQRAPQWRGRSCTACSDMQARLHPARTCRTGRDPETCQLL